MRIAALLLTLAACTDEPSIDIIAPLPDSTVVAVVELRLEGRELTGVDSTKIYVDLQPYSDLIEDTRPSDCDSCMFTITFGGVSIMNGMHTIGVYLYDGEKQVATDAVRLVFAR